MDHHVSQMGSDWTLFVPHRTFQPVAGLGVDSQRWGSNSSSINDLLSLDYRTGAGRSPRIIRCVTLRAPEILVGDPDSTSLACRNITDLCDSRRLHVCCTSQVAVSPKRRFRLGKHRFPTLSDRNRTGLAIDLFHLPFSSCH